MHPLDPEIGIDWPTTDRAGRPLESLLSDKDPLAPTLAEARAAGLLPQVDDVAGYVAAADRPREPAATSSGRSPSDAPLKVPSSTNG